jgi:hypothetical protein
MEDVMYTFSTMADEWEMIGAVGWSSTVSEGRFVVKCGETKSAARFLRGKDVGVHDQRVLERKDKEWSCHPVPLQLPAMCRCLLSFRSLL